MEMVNPEYKDETLRLLFARQEAEVIEEEIAYQKRSIIYGLLWIFATFLHLMMLPLMAIISSFWFQIYAGFTLLWALGAFCCLVGLIPCCIRVFIYRKYRKNHREFLAKYNRKTLSIF